MNENEMTRIVVDAAIEVHRSLAGRVSIAWSTDCRNDFPPPLPFCAFAPLR